MPEHPYFLPSETQRYSGREAQRTNLHAARLVAETVRTTLGPKGMDKMIVDAGGGITVTNDGVTILEEMNIRHPAARMVVEVARTQEHEVGDGTTTAVVLAGELLRKAEALLDQDVHPALIARGYHLAAAEAQRLLEAMAVALKPEDEASLRRIATTALTGKGTESAKEHLAALVVQAVRAVEEREDVALVRRTGGRVEDSELIAGVVLDKERAHPDMPRRVADAKVLLLNAPLEVRSPETEARISITEPAQLQGFLDMEGEMLRRMAERVLATGATVVVSQKGIDDAAQHLLAKGGVLAVRRAAKRDVERLAKATGARVLSSLDEAPVLGSAELVEEARVGEGVMLFVRGCPSAKALTLLVRGGTEHIVAEIARAAEDAVGVVNAAVQGGGVVAGAGAPELALAKGLAAYASSLSGREQLAVQAFADALEVIPRTLAENAGIDPIDALTALKAAHGKGERWAGINVFTGRKMDAWKAGVLEPLRVKTQAVSSAAEVATLILRIDDVISAEPAPAPRPEPSEGL